MLLLHPCFSNGFPLHPHMESPAKQGLGLILGSYMNQNFRRGWSVWVLPYLALPHPFSWVGSLQFFPTISELISFFLFLFSYVTESHFKVVDFHTTINAPCSLPFLSFMPQSLQNGIHQGITHALNSGTLGSLLINIF